MDLVTLATEVVAWLTPYLADAGHAAAKEGGKKLLAALERKFKGKPAAEEALQDVREFPTDEDAQAALRQQLKKALRTDPIFRDELAALWRSVSIQGDGNIAGNRNTVARDHSVAVGGNVNGDININTAPSPPGPRPADLRFAYLNHLFESVAPLSLAGIDPKAASDADKARLNLSAVYTGLLTLTPEERELVQQEPRTSPAGRGTGRRLSALAHLDKHPRLVLLGDPGSGKSTFVNFVTLCLAGEALGREDANLARLTAPLPQDDKERRKKKEPQPQPWSHGALLPVRVILRDFAAQGLPAIGRRATAKHLWDFIARRLKEAALGDYERYLGQELQKLGGLILLDGLDEVPEADRRREQIKQAVSDFAKSFPRCRILITSRTYAYQQQAWRLSNFSEAVLAPFGEGQIRRFVDRWYAHIAPAQGWSHDEAQGRAELLKRAIFGNERLQALAERPLLLTLMASLHAWRGGSLPEKREELYADTVDLLLEWWERPKVVRDTEGHVIVQQPSLAEWLQVDREQVRAVLNELAYQAHAGQPDMVGTADVSEGDLLSGLLALSRNPDVNPAHLVDYLSRRAGLLLPRGVKVYTFPHRTFQEYLAACHLTDHGYPDEVADLGRRDPNRWREVVLLAGAKAARGTASAVWSLVDALCYRDVARETDLPVEDAWGALLAGQILVESANLERVSERNHRKLDLVRQQLVYVLRADGLEGRVSLPPTERAAAGRDLARLGDPRFDPHRRYLPDEPMLGFVRIPAGEFWMGTRAQDIPVLLERFGGKREWYELETPQHKVFLPEYYIARYPVTVAQWRAFIEDSGHKLVDDRSLLDPGNHPVRYVTWYEALAYCKWLEEKLRTLDLPGLGNLSGLRVTLPSEAEWEKASRGTDGRRYPWGDEPDPNRANYDDTGIGTTSAVGCFPGGASPYGVEEMIGNVWEWTRSLWGEDFSKPKFAYPYVCDDGREDLEAERDILRVVRGGSFGNGQWYARCACRGRDVPFFHWLDGGFRVVLVVSPSTLDSDPLDSETLGL